MITAVPIPTAVRFPSWLSQKRLTDTLVPPSVCSDPLTAPVTMMVSPALTGRRNFRLTVPVWLNTSGPKNLRRLSLAKVMDIRPEARV